MKQNDFIVSCQALADEPLHSSLIMGKMALAALEGGANGIRANGIIDIKEIKRNTDLPIIGIIKAIYNDSEVYITPTIEEVTELVNEGVEIIAVDATKRYRPQNVALDKFFEDCKRLYPNQKFMADCSTVGEMMNAQELGFDYIGTTLFGYTSYSRKSVLEDDASIFKEIVSEISVPIGAEGNINTPEQAKLLLELGAYAVVVGGAITRPKQITRRFVECIRQEF